MIKKILSMLLAVALLQNAAHAQEKKDERTITTRIADLMAQMPARDAGLLKNNMNDIANLGEDGYVTLISGLSPAGKGNNALIEYAIGGFSAYVSQTGKEEWRKMSVNAYCKALQKLSDPQNKSFIISQFDLVGGDDAISCLQGFLTDNALADPAARALAKINSPASKTALLNALAQANGAAKLSIIEALGDSRFKAAAKPIQDLLASNSDPKLTKMALYALANIAEPSSETLFSSAAAKVGYQYENTNTMESYLIYASQLLNGGHTALAEKIARQLLTKTIADQQLHFRTAALEVLVKATSGNQEVLLQAAGDKNRAYRTAALQFALSYLSSANAALWIKKLNTADDDSKADIVYMLGQSQAKDVWPVLLQLTRSKQPKLKQEAINAVVNLGQDQALGDLLKLISKGDTSDISTVSDAIRRMKGTGVTAQVAAAIPSAPAVAQIALIRILAARSANPQLNAVYAQLKNKNPEVQQAAYAALSQMVIGDDLPRLFTLLNESSGSKEVAVQQAIIAAVSGAGDHTARVDAVLKQMGSVTEKKKLLFYKVLASLGGSQALKTVTEGYNQGNAEAQAAALDALSVWVNDGTAPELINIARETKNAVFLNTAIQGYLRLALAGAYPAEQRLLLLRNAMDVAQTNEQKQQILKAGEQAKCYNTILFAGRYLNDPALQQAAANTVMIVTMAGEYNGDLVRSLLQKTIEVITGPDSGYQKEGMRKYLSEMKSGEGFVSLYNGTDLSGWKGLVADPLKRAKMDASTLAAEQVKADAEARESWKPVDGTLLFTGHGNNLATVKKYGDFEMLVDWKIIDDKKGEGDAGIYLRGTPQVQIWDNARVKVGAQVGSGGLYNNQVNESKPLKVADNKLGEWNTFRILMKGDRVTVYLNGELVTDNVILENYWDRNLAIFAEEQIELQAHGSPVAYRDLYIREIPRVKPFELSAAEKKEGFKVLFDGTNMHNWTGNTVDYTIEDGNIAIRPKPGKGSGGNLYTKEEFSDFIFRFEFQLTPGANNGLGIRAPLEGDAAYVGMELQILDNEAPIYKDLHTYQYHGSIYGTIAAKRGFLKSVGEWNYEEVIVKGPKIKVILNGTTILDADITEARKNGAADGQKHPGLLRESGHIGFLGHGSEVQFRNIRVKDLSKKKSN